MESACLAQDGYDRYTSSADGQNLWNNEASNSGTEDKALYMGTMKGHIKALF